MPRYFFHLSAPGQVFPDPVGSDVDDLAAAHSRAVQLADRVMTYPVFADRASDLRRWNVTVTDGTRRALMNVLFPSGLTPGKRAPIADSGARALLRTLASLLEAGGSSDGVPAKSVPKRPRRTDVL